MILLFSLAATCAVVAQVSFRTLVKNAPVLVGEAFQVQYIIEGGSVDDDFQLNESSDFKYISGPNVYMGSVIDAQGMRHTRNVVYTMASRRAGRIVLPSAVARVSGKMIRSESAFIRVLSQQQAIQQGYLQPPVDTDNEYYLKPGEDPMARIKRNLFVKVFVDRTTCFVGQPVTAIFKLYSRLESKSDIVKNPGFYGFTVQDMSSPEDRLSGIEMINGKAFDVHTVRKVQLYPLSPGKFNVDAMDVVSRVEFTRSAVHRKTEQQIREGVLPPDAVPGRTGIEIFEDRMSTEPVEITVRPLPQQGQPANFDGATGKFNLSTNVEKTTLAQNEEGVLVVRITGKGNFTQLAAPVIRWPKGVEGFEPVTRDTLDQTIAPLKGTREFRFRFVSASPGKYTLPAVSFPFFDPDSNRYKTLSTDAVEINVTPGKPTIAKAETTASAKQAGRTMLFVFLAIGLSVIGIVSWIFLHRKRGRQKETPVPVKKVPEIDEYLAPAELFTDQEGRVFYASLRNCIWSYFSGVYNISGSTLNKSTLRQILADNHIPAENQREIESILDECDEKIFTNVQSKGEHRLLLERARYALRALQT